MRAPLNWSHMLLIALVVRVLVIYCWTSTVPLVLLPLDSLQIRRWLTFISAFDKVLFCLLDSEGAHGPVPIT